MEECYEHAARMQCEVHEVEARLAAEAASDSSEEEENEQKEEKKTEEKVVIPQEEQKAEKVAIERNVMSI